MFAKQIELHVCPDDQVIAISSSGRSANILNAVRAARDTKCTVVTLSGFSAENPLRLLGDVGGTLIPTAHRFVEIGHLTICHVILDFICGLRVPEEQPLVGAKVA